MGKFDSVNISVSDLKRLVTWTNNTVESLEDICSELENEDLVAMRRVIAILNRRKQEAEGTKVASPLLEKLDVFISNENKFIARFSYTPNGDNGSLADYHIPRITIIKESAVVNPHYKFTTGKYKEFWIGRIVFSQNSLGTHDLVFEKEPTLEDIEKVLYAGVKLDDKTKYDEIFE